MSLMTQAEFLTTALPDCEHTSEKKSQTSPQKPKVVICPSEAKSLPPDSKTPSYVRAGIQRSRRNLKSIGHPRLPNLLPRRSQIKMRMSTIP